MAFTRRGTLTITSNSSLLASTQTNFTVLVGIVNNNDLRTTGNGGSVANGSGFDIRFYSDFALSSALSFELESYDATSGTVNFRVLLPSMALGTVFYCGFGDAALNTNASSTSAWDSNFKCVLHLKETATDEGTTADLFQDSTSNNNDGDQAGTTNGTGQIGVCQVFDGTNDYVNLTNPASLQITGALTLSAWVKKTSAATSGRIISKSGGGSNRAADFTFESDDKLSAYIAISSTTTCDAKGVTAVTNSTWYYAATTYTPSVSVILYLNGVQDAIQTTSVPASQNDAGFNLYVGMRPDTSGPFPGSIDEVHIANVARSANWLLAEYNNQSAPSTFVSFSSASATAGTSPIPRSSATRSNIGRSLIVGGA